MLAVPVAHAQLGGLPLPQLPPVELPGVVTDTVSGVSNGIAAGALATARQLRVTELLRNNRRLLERDPQGNPMLRSQIVALAPSSQAMAQLSALGFAVAREQALEGLDTHLVVLRVPEGWSTKRALARSRKLDPDGIYDYDHIFLNSGQGSPAAVPTALAAQSVSPDKVAMQATGPRIGLIDGGVDTAHPVFRDTRIHLYGCAGKAVPNDHGTSVASLLVGAAPAFAGAAPGGELFAADVYCDLPTGGAVETVIEALAWLARSNVPVVNISLVGPPNKMLERIVMMMVARGHLIVAAVGNDGPAAAPLYPASYSGVTGVTGVDARRKVLPEAGRGSQVLFAAPGADMVAAERANSFAAVRGTSFAAPIVAGLLARSMDKPGVPAAAAALNALRAQAVDLGSPGLDPLSGYGLVGEKLRILPTAELLAKPGVRKSR